MRRHLSIGLLLLAPFGGVGAADLFNGTPSAIVEPDCIADPGAAFLTQSAPPEGRFTLIVRHLGLDALDVHPSYDFGAIEGLPLTNLSVPTPRGAWQRARSDQDPNYTSAFQVHCFDAGFFINTWRFEPRELIDEGPHVAYGFAFSDPPPAFDADPATDLVLQAELEVPWLYRPQGSAIAQTYFQIRLFDVSTERSFQMTFLLHQNTGVEFTPYADYARNDSLFVATPLMTNAVITRSPYSAAPSATSWTGLRFFRAQLTPANFRAAIDLVNGFCATRGDVPDCSVLPARATPLSIDPTHYVVSEFSVITEIFNADTDANGLSIGLHLRGLGLYNFR
jgi:hypothetical protein